MTGCVYARGWIQGVEMQIVICELFGKNRDAILPPIQAMNLDTAAFIDSLGCILTAITQTKNFGRHFVTIILLNNM
jgi:hypothetical protein